MINAACYVYINSCSIPDSFHTAFPRRLFLNYARLFFNYARLFFNYARLFFNYARLFVNSSRLFSKTNTDFQNLPTASPSAQYLAFYEMESFSG